MDESAREVPSPLPHDVESRPGLLRALGPGMALAMVVGNVIGSGIFFKPGTIAADAGSFPLIISTWLIGGGLCLLGALCFAELAAMLPRAGGLYVYLREAYGRPVAFLFGWIEFCFARPAGIGALAIAFIGALDEAIGRRFSTFDSVGLALVVIGAMTWVNVLGVVWGGRVQAATTLVKAGFLGLLALLPFILLAAGFSGFEPENYASTVVPKETTLSARFAAAMLAVMWAYNGWHAITPVAEEVREPQKNIPRALFGGIGLLVLLYVAANVAYHGVLSMSEMASAGESAAQTMVHKLLEPIGPRLTQVGVAIMSAVIMCSTFGAINSNILNGPRISFAMGRDGVFVRALGRVHVNYRTPATAIIVQAILAGGLIVATTLYVQRNGVSQNVNGQQTDLAAAADGRGEPTVLDDGDVNPDESQPRSLRPISQVFDSLTNFVVFSASIFYVLAVAAVFVLRRKHPDWERPYRTLGYPLVPVLYIGFYAWFLFYVYLGNPFEAKVGLGLVALGVPVYYGWRAWAARHPEIMHDGE